MLDLLVLTLPLLMIQRRQSEVHRSFRMLCRDSPARARHPPDRRAASRVLTVHARYRGRQNRTAQDGEGAWHDHHRV